LSGRSTNVSETITFLVAKIEKVILVMIKGRPKSEDAISLAALEQSINPVAYIYIEKHLGRRRRSESFGRAITSRPEYM